MDVLPISEGDLKRQIGDYLQYGANQGKWYYDRLNTGSFILTDKDGNFRRRVQGAKKGTADFLVIKMGHIIFLEIKAPGKKSTPAQDEFAELVRRQGCAYHIIRSVEELQDAIS